MDETLVPRREPKQDELLLQQLRIYNFLSDAIELQKLFRYIAGACWGGRQLTQKGIAIDFFKADDNTFDAKKNNVSVSVGRLRDALDEYYASTGAADPIRISIPVGAYRMEYQLRSGYALEAPSIGSSRTGAASDFQTPPSSDSTQQPSVSSFNWRKLMRRAIIIGVPVAIVTTPIDFGVSAAVVAFAAVVAGIGWDEIVEHVDQTYARRESRQGTSEQQTSKQTA